MLALLKIFLLQTKSRLCVLVALSGSFGYILARPRLDRGFFLTTLAMLLVAGAAASLNNLQDQSIDAADSRTRGRPLPTGQISRSTAWLLCAVLFAAGYFLFMRIDTSHRAARVCLLAVLLYNGLYTPLKRVSLYDLIPGALSGALPIAIGYLSAEGGNQYFIPKCAMAIVVLWQLPHILILLSHIRRDGHPYASSCAMQQQLMAFPQAFTAWVILAWISAMSGLMLFFPFIRFVQNQAVAYLILCNAIFIVLFAAVMVFRSRSAMRYRRLFAALNAAIAIFMGLIICDRI